MSVNTKAELEAFVCHHWEAINKQIDQWQSELPQPIYSSIDVRESKDKYAPVDHNLYPAGWNNICQKDLTKGAPLFKRGIEKVAPGAKRIGVIPESNTRNKWYLENVHHLTQTLKAAGYEVEIISPDKDLFVDGNTITLETQTGHQLTVSNATALDGFLQKFDGSKFDVIMINHDQSMPLDVDWKQLKTPVVPSPFAGWNRRQKNAHFRHYQAIANKFAKHFDINPCLIQARFRAVENVDFETKEGIDALAEAVDELLKVLPAGSSVFAKASQGTYGMGISVFTSKDEVLAMNRRTRNKMDVGKNNIKFTSILVQEGVETVVKVEDAPAEITMYLVDGKSLGGFMRYNPEKGTNANLNSQGMLYRKFCISDICQDTDTHVKEAVYALIGRLSVLAASHELQEIEKEQL